jgi:hypothetical protein
MTEVQVWANAGLTAKSQPANAVAIGMEIFVFINVLS